MEQTKGWKLFVYTQLSLKSELCLVVLHNRLKVAKQRLHQSGDVLLPGSNKWLTQSEHFPQHGPANPSNIRRLEHHYSLSMSMHVSTQN